MLVCFSFSCFLTKSKCRSVIIKVRLPDDEEEEEDIVPRERINTGSKRDRQNSVKPDVASLQRELIKSG